MTMESGAYSLYLLQQRLAVCRLPADAAIPQGLLREEFWSLTRTPDELSLVCREEAVPPRSVFEGGWRALKVAGPLEFSLTGVLSVLTAPLAEQGVSVFALSTYDTDYLLIKEDQLAAGLKALRASPAVLEVREE